jgi:hypothetical protein
MLKVLYEHLNTRHDYFMDKYFETDFGLFYLIAIPYIMAIYGVSAIAITFNCPWTQP